MRYLDLEFGRPVWHWTLRSQMLLVVCAAMALVACTLCWRDWKLLSSTREMLQKAEARVGTPHDLGAKHQQLSMPTQNIRRINRAIDDLNIPWPALLGMVESTVSPKISLRSVTPDPVTRTVALEADAENEQAMLSFAADLERRPEVAEVRFIKHQTDRAEPGHLVFDLAVLWKSDL